MKANRLFPILLLAPACLVGVAPSGPEVLNRAELGAAFVGVSADATGAIRNLAGPSANFVDPIRLIARSTGSKVVAGESIQLDADVLLDDGTITQLDPEEVTWAIDTAVASVSQSGLLTATQVTKRVRVKVTATAEGYAAEVRVRIHPAPAQTGQTASAVKVPVALADSFSLGAGWLKSPWFGAFFPTRTDWLHHADLGWLFMQDDGAGNMWLWEENHEWLWTGKDIYPHLYRHKDETWLYFMLEDLPDRNFYNQTTHQVENPAP